MKLPKGKYYIGDPSYVFRKSWDEVLKKTDYFSDSETVVFGKRIVGGSTAYGDGSYKDNYGRSYAVDSGTIAILPVSLLLKDKEMRPKEIEADNDMHIVKMEKDFDAIAEDGIFTFGDIVINTRDTEEEDD